MKNSKNYNQLYSGDLLGNLSIDKKLQIKTTGIKLSAMKRRIKPKCGKIK